MPDLNKVLLMGNLTRDPEVRYTPKGSAVGDLSIAINRVYRTDDGQSREEVCYVDIVVWGRQAETCKEYLQKGRPIFVEGRLQLDQWESNGEKKSKLRVVAERIQFLGGGGGGGQGGQSSGGGYKKPYNAAGAAPSSYPSEGGAPAPSAGGNNPPPPQEPPAEDDIPF
jgi:single-strand DNA-binding protein